MLHKRMKQYFERGGLPGLCFIRSDQAFKIKISEQLSTILDRDLRLVKKIQLPFTDIRQIVTVLADAQGLPLDFKALSHASGVSYPSLKKVIYALEAVFIIRLIPIQGSTQGHTVFFEDQAEHRFLRSTETDFLETFTHFCFTQLRTQFHYRKEDATLIFQYRTRGGAHVPFAFQNKAGTLGIIPVQEAEDASRVIGSVNSFLKSYSKSNILIVHPENSEPKIMSSRIACVPVGSIL